MSCCFCCPFPHLDFTGPNCLLFSGTETIFQFLKVLRMPNSKKSATPSIWGTWSIRATGKPLILRFKLITLEFLATIPSGLHYIDMLEAKNIEEFKDVPEVCTKCAYARTPPNPNANQWDGFTGEVLGIVADSQEREFGKPICLPYFNVPSEMRVQSVFESNILFNIQLL